MPIVPLPDELNPFKDDGVEISLAIGWGFPGGDSIKAVSVIGMLWDAHVRGKLEGVRTLIEGTSGNTGMAEITFGREQPFLIRNTKLVVQPDLAVGKRGPLVLAGATLIEPEGTLSGIATARKMGGGGWSADDSWKADNGTLCLDQYGNLSNMKAHALYTGRKILDQEPDVSVFCAGIGTGGTIAGVSECLRGAYNDVTVVGVLCAPGEKVPGVRDLDRMKEVNIPWREAIDAQVEIGTRAAYLMTQWLIWLTPWSFGPSSGFALTGALKFLRDRKLDDDLESLRIKEGTHKRKIKVVVLCPDTYRPYIDHFHADLTSEMLRRSTAPRPWTLLW